MLELVHVPNRTDVRLWRVALDRTPAEVAELRSLLTDDELARADRFIHDDVRRRFIVARGSLRTLLASRLGTPARDLRFAYGEHGRPYVEGAPVSFNLSHSRELALVGVAESGVLGVDVEAIRERVDIDGVAKTAFCDNECVALAAVPEHARRDAFFATWTRKEAYLKALGTGFSVSSRAFEVTVDPAASPRVLHGARGEPVEQWSLATFPPCDGYVASIARIDALPA